MKKKEKNNNKYHNVGKFQNINKTIVERNQIETSSTQMHDP